MPEKYCPLFALAHRSLPPGDHRDTLCTRDLCAWWTNDRCAMVDLCAGIDLTTSCLSSIDSYLHVIANHGGDSR